MAVFLWTHFGLFICYAQPFHSRYHSAIREVLFAKGQHDQEIQKRFDYIQGGLEIVYPR